jgi:hypothetical protein
MKCIHFPTSLFHTIEGQTLSHQWVFAALSRPSTARTRLCKLFAKQNEALRAPALPMQLRQSFQRNWEKIRESLSKLSKPIRLVS